MESGQLGINGVHVPRRVAEVQGLGIDRVVIPYPAAMVLIVLAITTKIYRATNIYHVMKTVNGKSGVFGDFVVKTVALVLV